MADLLFPATMAGFSLLRMYERCSLGVTATGADRDYPGECVFPS